EVAGIGAPDPVGDFANRHIGLTKQRFGAFDSAPEDVLMWRQAYGLPECMREMTRADGERCSDVGKRQVPVQIVLDVLDGAPQLGLRQLRWKLVAREAMGGVLLEQVQR